MSELLNINGIGPKTEKYFLNLGINSIKDLLYFFPKDYEEYDEPKHVIDLVAGKVFTVNAMVVTKPSIFKKGRTSITQVWLDDGTARIRAFWFNIPFINKTLTIGKNFIFRGRVNRVKDGIVLSQCKIFKEETYNSFKGSLFPIYHLTKGLTNNVIKKVIINVLNDEEKNRRIFEEYLPESIRKERNLCHLDYAFNHIHFPKELDDMKIARQRLVYDEFFLFSLAMQKNKSKNTKKGIVELKDIDIDKIKNIINDLPYELTNDQKKALNDIFNDFKNGKKMNRLIEGDVGSGKTIVAILASLMVVDKNMQVGFMAPTEILAEQHFNTLVNFLSNVKQRDKSLSVSKKETSNIFTIGDITIALLTGSTKIKHRREILEKLRNGDIDILVGTHALYSNDVIYKNLALCITDEQHRFGVGQRKSFEEKSLNANVLIMSATPIPRTLAMLLYADMDISKIVDKPKNRIPIKNFVMKEDDRERVYKSIKKQIDMGHQAYVICPAIEKDDKEDIGSFANYQNVYDYKEKLELFFGKGIEIGVLHGKMKPDEKYTVMNEFKDGKIKILVSTTVVEVGVDVPNATVIMIEDAGAFGLSELHQLRGRVGRNEFQSYAVFIDTLSTDKSIERLNVLANSNDGFYIAEEDLKLRGPGDIFGIKQSGAMDFKLADMYTDIGIFRAASVDAKEFIKKNMKETTELKNKLDEYLKMGIVI